MRAVNLMPSEPGRSGARRASALTAGPGYLAVFVLAAAVVLTLIAVLTNNTISDRRAKLVTVRAEVALESAQAARLTKYTAFVAAAQQRAETVRQIAAGRFNWQAALQHVADVVPTDTSFQSLSGSVSSATSSGGGGAGALRGAIDAPAFEITGCTASQDEVARLMYRLRSIAGVKRVTLGSTQKSGGVTGTVTSQGATRGCVPGTPMFDLVVFFAPIPGSSSTVPGGGSTATSPAPVSGVTTTAKLAP